MKTFKAVSTQAHSASFILAILVCTAMMSACSNGGAGAVATEVPALLERPAGLQIGEFQRIRAQEAELRAILQTDPHDVPALVGMARIFMYEARVTGEHPYYYPAADRLADRALAIDSLDYAALVTKGSILLSLHRFDEARTLAERAVAVDAELAVGWGVLCDARLELGDYEGAVSAADRMVALRPNLQSYARVSYLREIHGDMEGAIEVMRMAVRAGMPQSEEKAWARTTLGDMYLTAGAPGKAEEQYTMAALERENYPFALAGLARIREMRGEFNEALKLADKALALAPEFAFAELKAEIYRKNGAAHVADSLVAVIVDMLREDEEAGHAMDRELALLFVQHNIRPDDAQRRIATEIARRPDNIEALHAAAQVYMNADPAKARAYMAKALRLGTQDATMLAHAGLIEARLGNEHAAITYLEKALSINPFLPAGLREEIDAALQRV